jgi:hypothetical protein
MTTTAILGLLAQTSIHAGVGSQTGIIDLPIQREAITVGLACLVRRLKARCVIGPNSK